jgi:hypothetical protein
MVGRLFLGNNSNQGSRVAEIGFMTIVQNQIHKNNPYFHLLGIQLEKDIANKI